MLNRRTLLRSAGAAVALPLLEALPRGPRPEAPARRLVAVGSYLGFYKPALYPQASERLEAPLLEPLAHHRGRCTLLAGLDHNGPNGHAGWRTYLTGPDARSVSLDQLVAAAPAGPAVGTRYRSLELSAGPPGAGSAMPVTREGIPLPMEFRPSAVYARLFGDGTDARHLEYLLDSHRSVLDLVRADARRLERDLGAADRERLDQYFTALRDVEQQLAAERAWLDVPKPEVDFEPGPDDFLGPEQLFDAAEALYRLMALALSTDSTRVVTLYLPGLAPVFTIDGQKLVSGYHGLSHHNQNPEKIAGLLKIDRRHLTQLAGFLERLEQARDEEGRPLLDTTVVLYGTGMGDASRHSNQDVPMLVAGGPFGHGRQGRFVDLRAENGEAPTGGPVLADLFVSILRSLGLEHERFANSGGDLDRHLY